MEQHNENLENTIPQEPETVLSAEAGAPRKRQSRRPQKSRGRTAPKSTAKILQTILMTVVGLAALFALTVYITYTLKTGDRQYVDYNAGNQVVEEDMDGMSDEEKINYLEGLVQEKDTEIEELQAEVDRLTIQAQQVTGSIQAPVSPSVPASGGSTSSGGSSSGGSSGSSSGGSSGNSSGGSSDRRPSGADSGTGSSSGSDAGTGSNAGTSAGSDSNTGTGTSTPDSAFGTVVDPETTIIEDEPGTGSSGAEPDETTTPATSDTGL